MYHRPMTGSTYRSRRRGGERRDGNWGHGGTSDNSGDPASAKHPPQSGDDLYEDPSISGETSGHPLANPGGSGAHTGGSMFPPPRKQ